MRGFNKITLLTIISLSIFLFSCQGNKKWCSIMPSKVILLGDGYANNSINTVIFRHDGILTRDKCQFTSFYDPDGNIIIVKRDLSTDTIEKFKLEGSYLITDAHNCINIGIDAENYLHISYDTHGTKLRYRRALIPLSIQEWTDEIPMTGNYEEMVTYPTFLMSPLDSADYEGKKELLFLYRIYRAGRGDAILKSYNYKTKKWEERAIRFLKGTESLPWTCSPYWNHPVFDKHGNLHISFVWRFNKGGPANLIINSSIGYVMSPDNGLSWFSSLGKELQSPITPVNYEIIYPISPGSNIINQTSSAVDSKGNLHIAYYSNDENGVPQYQHLWFDGKKWQNRVVSNRNNQFDLISGPGTLQIPISRPEILIDRKDNVYIIFRGDLTKNNMAIVKLKYPNYNVSRELIIWDKDLQYTEPIIDKVRWKRDEILSMLIQKNNQPNFEGIEKYPSENVYIVEWDNTF